MIDLIAASMILGGLALLAFAYGLWIGKHGSSKRKILSEIVATALLAAYLLSIWERPLLVDLIPGSGMIILANWLPLWGSFFIGIYAASSNITRERRVVLSTVTIVLVGYSGIAPLLGTAPTCTKSLLANDLQHQTTPYTCSPAAAVSMLRIHGIRASEGEMAELCLTRQGTHWMGLYRGLKLKTEGTEWTVSVEPYNAGSLASGDNLPCVLSVNIDTSRFEPYMDHGFIDGHGHSVVLLKWTDPKRAVVFDPSPDFGIEVWGDSILSSVSSGMILRLVPRDRTSPHVLAAQRRAGQLATQTLTAGLDMTARSGGLSHYIH